VEQAVQPQAERVELLAEPVDHDVGLVQLAGGLLAGGEQKDQ
jgi:hypothetical protein